MNDASGRKRGPHWEAQPGEGLDAADQADVPGGAPGSGRPLLSIGVPADLGDGLLVMDRGGIVERVSPRFSASTGYSAEDLVGKRARQTLFTTGGRRTVRRRLRRQGDQEGRFDVELVCKDGGLLWLEMELAPLLSAAGEPVGALAVFHDASKQRQARKALSASEQRLRVLLGQVPAILWTTDRDLRFTSGAGSGLATLELDAGEVMGMSLQEFFGTDDPDFLAIAEHRRAVAGHPASYDFEWAGVLYSVYLEPLRSRSGGIDGVVGIAIDVTERKALEARLEEARRLAGELAALLAEAGEDPDAVAPKLGDAMSVRRLERVRAARAVLDRLRELLAEPAPGVD